MRSIHSAVLAVAVLATGAVAAGAQSTARDSARAARHADSTWTGHRGDSTRAARRAQDARPGRRAQAARPARGEQGARGQRRASARPMAQSAFRGIQLTDTEKANLKAVRARYQPQMKAMRDSMRPDFKALREARQKGDSAALKAFRSEAAAQREQSQAVMQKMNADMRAALTPEHQTQFDTNMERMKERAGKRGNRSR